MVEFLELGQHISDALDKSRPGITLASSHQINVGFSPCSYFTFNYGFLLIKGNKINVSASHLEDCRLLASRSEEEVGLTTRVEEAISLWTQHQQPCSFGEEPSHGRPSDRRQ